MGKFSEEESQLSLVRGLRHEDGEKRKCERCEKCEREKRRGSFERHLTGKNEKSGYFDPFFWW